VLSEGSGIPQASKPKRLTKQIIQRQTKKKKIKKKKLGVYNGYGKKNTS